jgi:hypothetical protein
MIDVMADLSSIDLTNCGREPIHILGQIQIIVDYWFEVTMLPSHLED